MPNLSTAAVIGPIASRDPILYSLNSRSEARSENKQVVKPSGTGGFNWDREFLLCSVNAILAVIKIYQQSGFPNLKKTPKPTMNGCYRHVVTNKHNY